MKFKLQQVINPATLQALENLSLETAMPKSAIWPLAKTINKLKTDLADWNAAKQVVFKKYGAPVDAGFEIPKDKIADVNAELQVVLESEIEMPLNESVKLPSVLPDTSKLTAQDLSCLLELGVVAEE